MVTSSIGSGEKLQSRRLVSVSCGQILFKVANGPQIAKSTSIAFAKLLICSIRKLISPEDLICIKNHVGALTSSPKHLGLIDSELFAVWLANGTFVAHD